MEQRFDFNGHLVRMISDQDEQYWFAGIDVCNILGYVDSHQKIKSLDEDEYRLDRIIDGQGKSKETLTVNEFGLYSLILSSTKPEAKEFKRWITHGDENFVSDGTTDNMLTDFMENDEQLF